MQKKKKKPILIDIFRIDKIYRAKLNNDMKHVFLSSSEGVCGTGGH